MKSELRVLMVAAGLVFLLPMQADAATPAGEAGNISLEMSTNVVALEKGFIYETNHWKLIWSDEFDNAGAPIRDGDAFTVFAINRHLTESLPLVTGLPIPLARHITLCDADPLATNTRETPDRVVPRPAPKPGTLPPLSWNVLKIRPGDLTAPKTLCA